MQMTVFIQQQRHRCDIILHLNIKSILFTTHQRFCAMKHQLNYFKKYFSHEIARNLKKIRDFYV